MVRTATSNCLHNGEGTHRSGVHREPGSNSWRSYGPQSEVVAVLTLAWRPLTAEQVLATMRTADRRLPWSLETVTITLKRLVWDGRIRRHDDGPVPRYSV